MKAEERLNRFKELEQIRVRLVQQLDEVVSEEVQLMFEYHNERRSIQRKRKEAK